MNNPPKHSLQHARRKLQRMATMWGIAGCGLISHDFTNAMVGVLPEDQHRVVAVAARRKEDAETFALKHNIPRAYSDYAELASDPDVDVRMYAHVIKI